MTKTRRICRLAQWLVAIALMILLPGCGDDDAADTTSSGGGAGSSMCASEHACSNSVCECTNDGKVGESCCDDDTCDADDPNYCETFCEVCQ